MEPYASPNEQKVGANRPVIHHLPEDGPQRRTRSERRAEKEGVTAMRRKIKKSARRHLQQQMLLELEADE
ncbi:hypothetical protein BH18VER1_BH18VER1_19970 [soil metagenome]